jgi:hypothetical protein
VVPRTWRKRHAVGTSSATNATLAEQEAFVIAPDRTAASDSGTFEPTEASDDEPADRHELMNSEDGADVLECEVGGYLVRA